MKRYVPLRRSRINPINKRRRSRSGIPGKLGIVRLYGADLEALRRECFERDGYRCVPCGKAVIWEAGFWNSGHMAHRKNKRMYGDFIDNVDTKCIECHLVHEHNPRAVPPKK